MRPLFRFPSALGLVLAGLGVLACADDPAAPGRGPVRLDQAALHSLTDTVRQLAASRNVTPLPSPAPVRPALVTLGQALAFDKELSGNRDISCMTCHFPAYGTGDGRSLSIGTGATGLGPGRQHPQGLFIPRNAPPLFNLGALKSLFWDGRVSVDAEGTYHTPARQKLTRDMTRAFEFGAVSAFPLFPVLARDEMRGFSGNELASIPDEHVRQIWAGLMERLGRIPEYRQMFEAAYPGVRFERMNFGYASNAIAGFLIDKFHFNNSPWDRFLAGNDQALTEEQLVGARDFLSLRCAACHNGPAFTDNQFHNVAVPQLGPGKGNGSGLNDDYGRFNIRDHATMQYAFRTPGLRNVVLTGPYGHDGAFASLRDFIAHYSDSDVKLRTFDPLTLEPLLQGTLVDNADAILATRDTLLNGVVLPDSIVDHLMAFMDALTDDPAHYPSVIPARVPSGLPVDAVE